MKVPAIAIKFEDHPWPMSKPSGATYDLENLIWRKPLLKLVAGVRYDLVFCDGATGAVKHKRWNISADDARASLESHPDYHPFAYLAE